MDEELGRIVELPAVETVRGEAGRKSEAHTTDPQTGRIDPLAASICPICTTSLLSTSFITLHPCAHSFCRHCIIEYVEDKVQSQGATSIFCPSHKCTNRLEDSVLETLLSGLSFSKFLRFRVQSSLDSDPSIRWCPRPGCSGYARLTGTRRKLVCEECGWEYCRYCQGKWHEGGECSQGGDAKFEKWVKKTGVKFCPQCRVKVEKNQGCPHMTCVRCRYEWCWACGLAYSGHSRCPVLRPHWANQPWRRCLFLLFLPLLTLFILPIYLAYYLRFWWNDSFRPCPSKSLLLFSVTFLGLLLTPLAFSLFLPLSGILLLIYCYKECECCDSLWLRCFLGLITGPLGLSLSPIVISVILTIVVTAPVLGVITVLLKSGVALVRCAKKDFLKVKGAPGYPLG